MHKAPNTPSYYVHGDEGFGDLPAQTPRQGRMRLMQLIISSRLAAPILARSHLPVGPLTNIAIALQRDPELVKHVKSVVIMGGAGFVPGNVTDYAEANIWNDPHAADIVFAADWEVVMIGLDVTTQVMCYPKIINQSQMKAAKLAPLLMIFHNSIRAFMRLFIMKTICVLHDPCAVIAITDPELFEYRTMPLHVICEGEAIGQTVPDATSDRHPVKIAIGVDVDHVKAHYLSISKQADISCASRLWIKCG